MYGKCSKILNTFLFMCFFFAQIKLCYHGFTVKPVLSGYLKIDKIMVLMENGILMKVESIAECSPWSILQYF